MTVITCSRILSDMNFKLFSHLPNIQKCKFPKHSSCWPQLKFIPWDSRYFHKIFYLLPWKPISSHIPFSLEYERKRCSSRMSCKAWPISHYPLRCLLTPEEMKHSSQTLKRGRTNLGLWFQLHYTVSPLSGLPLSSSCWFVLKVNRKCSWEHGTIPISLFFGRKK